MLAATGWLAPLASRVLRFLDTGTYRSAGSFLLHGYAYLPLRTPDDCSVYLRVPDVRVLTAWPVRAPQVVLTMAGTTTLETYQDSDDARAGRAQYARTFDAGEFFAVHPGTLCATRGTVTTVQVLAVTEPVAGRGRPLSGEVYTRFARRARRQLEQASLTRVGGPC
ncbi:hypothetical protein ABT301_12340 [Streptomyces sp. NPDC000987]|uniref:hypothetical protein n=1 Tax=Streptomyces sp. NPDC000987 TaxID=3154374 RepID=UPI00332602A0